MEDGVTVTGEAGAIVVPALEPESLEQTGGANRGRPR